MAVEFTPEYKCKRCGRAKGPLNKWWLVRTDGADWTFRDFAPHALPDYSYAICSLRCLMDDAQAHAEKLLKAHVIPETQRPQSAEPDATGEP